MSHQEPSSTDLGPLQLSTADFVISPQKLNCVMNENESDSNHPCEEAVNLNKLGESVTSIQYDNDRMTASPGMSMHNQPLVCPMCSKIFAWKNSLVKHMKIHSGEQLFVCKICARPFTRNDALKRHKIIHSQENYFKCEICDRSFQRQHYYTMHMLKHNRGDFNCKFCGHSFASVKTKQQHERENHSASALTKARGELPTAAESSKRIKREEKALNSFTTVYFEPLEEMQRDFILFFAEVAPHIQSKLNEELHVMHAIKWYGVVKATLVRISENGEEESATPYFRSDVLLELVSDTIERNIQQAFTKIRMAFDEFVERGSGWILEKIEHFELCIAKYQPLRGNKYD